MARAYSQDLRDRVIDAALGGMPARRVAAQFEIGVATAIVWVRRVRASGERTARRQGQPRHSKLDPQRDFLLGLVGQTPDMTIVEMQQRLVAERGIKASVGTIWTFLDRCGLTFKKSPRTRRSRVIALDQGFARRHRQRALGRPLAQALPGPRPRRPGPLSSAVRSRNSRRARGRRRCPLFAFGCGE
jgi:transposase